MKPLYTETEFKAAKSTDKLPCECYYCGETFSTIKKSIKQEVKHKRGRIKFCSQTCNAMNQKTRELVKCDNCGTQFFKKLNQINKTKNNFCSRSCNASYNNKNKNYGTRRSKLEVWLEDQLTILYPDLNIYYNKSDAIGSELDIFIPFVNLAIELNGIFHYEPIYGLDKLKQIQENDKSKTKACHDNKIDLCIIDTSGQKYFKTTTSQKYLDIITNIIKERLSTS
jgi:hypothetical protein